MPALGQGNALRELQGLLLKAAREYLRLADDIQKMWSDSPMPPSAQHVEQPQQQQQQQIQSDNEKKG
jgi:hypothetical protein